jgi:endogenous inhibitor of DNA gyrase (YacG/DUF329 family)
MQGQSTTEWPEFPFCSKRCRLIDFKRWLGEEYRIPPVAEGEAPATEDDDEVP